MRYGVHSRAGSPLESNVQKVMKRDLLLFITLLFLCGARAQSPAERYRQMQRELAVGWNTWDTRSVLKHVLLPCGAAIDIHVEDADGGLADKFQIGAYPQMRPGAHTYDGTYTDISLEWNGHRLRVQSTADGRDNVILITPEEHNRKDGKVVVVPESVWYRVNRIRMEGTRGSIAPFGEDFTIDISVKGEHLATEGNKVCMSADEPVLICCGRDLTLEQGAELIAERRERFVEANKRRYGEKYEAYNAMQNVLAWDNMYDPGIDRVITPVSRIWNVNWSANPALGGFVLFCWDTYFAAMMLAIDNKELAYSNAVEITSGVTEQGFVPNFFSDNNYKTRDRSQPPVGSFAVWNIYRQYGEKWFLELVYDNLLTWNRWWDANRSRDGLLCWGSDPYEKITYRWWETDGVNERYGASLESGLDNSHMYDDIEFDKQSHILKLNDVGLTALYVMDCQLLANIAGELGRRKDVAELKRRAEKYGRSMEKLWDEPRGFYYNRHTDSGELNPRISPTNFYPMLGAVPTQERAERMIEEHMLNPDEFWGDWILPSTPRNDPAFGDNVYWRGRIWAPLNFLVYSGMCRYDLGDVRRRFAEKSEALLLKSWLENRYVFENYNSVTGVGDDVRSSDKFYHWGGLLGFIALIESGYWHLYFN